MSRIPLNEDMIDGEDCGEADYLQSRAEGDDEYETELDFDKPIHYVEMPVLPEGTDDV